MGDIPRVKNACNEKDNLYVESWGFYANEAPEGFEKVEDGYSFPKRLLDKAFTLDGDIVENAPTFKQFVRDYWNAYHHYRKYREEI